MSAININIKDSINFSGITDKVNTVVSQQLEAFGFDVVADAKRNAPDNLSFLKNNISTYLEGDLKVFVVASAPYAAYQEFGTRQFAAAYVATLPAEWQEFAAQYKGSGSGSFEDLLRRIKRWVLDKGITPDNGTTLGGTSVSIGKQSKPMSQDQLAYLIARKIATVGIIARPFLIPAVEDNKVKLITNLKAALN